MMRMVATDAIPTIIPTVSCGLRPSDEVGSVREKAAVLYAQRTIQMHGYVLPMNGIPGSSMISAVVPILEREKREDE